jgi:hypothetical protein
VNNANKIATRLVYDTLRVELVWANRIEGAPMPRHQITPLSDDGIWFHAMLRALGTDALILGYGILDLRSVVLLGPSLGSSLGY